MEGGALDMKRPSAPDPGSRAGWSLACLRRRAWAQSKDSLWQEPGAESPGPQGDAAEQNPSEEAGAVPNNKITSWLSECRSPSVGASLDDPSASPNRGALKNGCSFEDDLSLGAEANHLQGSKSESHVGSVGLVVDQRRTQFKERGRSMNSTGSGKSSNMSSLSELLDLYEEDPEEILYNLGFGTEEPDIASRVPTRFFNSTSSARGIDIKVYLGAQLQRMEVENPNYALTNRFRQIEVLTSVANEFFQLYSQVSGQTVQPISSRDKAEGGGAEEACPPLKRSNSALNAVKLLKKTITKHNLLGGMAESPKTHTVSTNRETPHSGHNPSEHHHANGYVAQDDSSAKPDHQVETVSQKNSRKKDNCLATVTEESNGDGETDRLTEDRPGVAIVEPHRTSTDLYSTNEVAEERVPVIREEGKNLTSTPEKAPPHEVQLCSEHTPSFDMDEVQSNEDAPTTTSTTADMVRTVSQQSDSSGFAEDPSTELISFLKVQESCDSCDSETTVTSHPSVDVATPLAFDQPVFVLQVSRVEEAEPDGPTDAAGSCSPRAEEEQDGSAVQIPQYLAHQLPRKRSEDLEEERGENGNGTDLETEHIQNLSATEPEPQHPHIRSASEPESGHTQIQPATEPETQIQTESATDVDPPTGGAVNCQAVFSQEERDVLATTGPVCPPAPSCLVLNALNRAKQNRQSRARPRVDPQTPARGRDMGPLQRSSSLPSSFLSPSRVVSSVRIQFGQGQASCTPPAYSYKYSHQKGREQGQEEDQQEEREVGQNNCLSTLIINPASSNNQPARVPTEAPPTPPKPIPRYLQGSMYSLQSLSPPPNCSSAGRTHSWGTQSVPDLSSHQQNPGPIHQNISTNQNQIWNSGPILFPSSGPNPIPSLNSITFPNHSPNPYSPNPPPHYPSPLHLYSSLPNLLQPPFPHHSSNSSLHRPTTPTIPMHEAPAPLAPHHAGLSNLHHHHPPIMHHSGYTSSPYPGILPGSPFVSPYFGYHGYMAPHLGYANTAPQCPPLAPEHALYPGLTASAPAPGSFLGLDPAPGVGHSLHHPGFSGSASAPSSLPDLNPNPSVGPLLHPGLTVPAPSAPGCFPFMALAPAPGFHPDLDATLPGLSLAPGSTHNLHSGLAAASLLPPGLGHNPHHEPVASSSTEMQLRRVLHDIRGTVQSMSQSGVTSPDSFGSALPNHQSLVELQKKRRGLNLFRTQMMDLEVSIIRQQAQVYRHLSPADRLEVEQLQSLRSEVREELQELEQQLEDRLMGLTYHTNYKGFHRDNSVDSLSTTSALRAMEPMSDLLREQLLLQSELCYDGHTPSTGPSSRSSSPVRGGGEQKGGVFSASVNIIPAPAPRPNTHTEEEEAEEGGEAEGEERAANQGGGGVRLDSMQQFIREIRESVTQEVRQEIYSELLAAVSPRQPSSAIRQQPL
ncbi:protein ITPRID2 isoform X2 [Genypterus blacodes]|uniref:protein ITPRID2 isoform X2 n=1 Tax=Genypterus blacodes TaxID=154954 RepID=UPI003F76FA22